MDPQQWRKIRSLFDELVELEPSARKPRLEQIGADAPDVRDQLATLLAADERASGELRPDALSDVRDQEPIDGDWLGLTGRQISHFRVLEVLGAGGMGVIYRAEDIRLNRPVALKLPLPHTHLEPDSRSRFLREARAVASLDHTNLCTIYDVGETPGGILFIAMPLYEGETLANRLAREGRLSVAEAVFIAKQVAAGLACAHAAGVVHRDLKPANVMILPDQSIKLLDFGLAKSDLLSHSEPTGILGTLAYMSPEQLSGEDVDGRTDLWALGAIVYEMLTGRRPFRLPKDLVDLPVPPSAIRPEVPPALDRLVLRLLERDPDRRSASATSLRDELEAIVGENVARGALLPTPTRGVTRRTPTRARALAIGMITILAAALTVAKLWPPARVPVRSIAVIPFDNLSGDREADAIAAGLHDDLITQLARIDGFKVVGRGAVAAFANSDLPPRHIGRALNAMTLVEATVRRVGDSKRVNVRLIDAATGALRWGKTYDLDDAGLLTSHQEIAASIAAELGVRLSEREKLALERLRTGNSLALQAYWQGRFYSNQLTPFALRIALEAFDRAIALDSTFAPAWAGKAEACVLAFIGVVLQRLEPCGVAAQTAVRLDDGLAEAHSSSALIATLQWDWERAESEFLQALALDPTSDPARQGYGNLLRTLERPEEAIEQFRRAFEQSPTNLYAMTQIGWALFDQRRYAEALNQYDAVIRRDPAFWLPLYNKGLVYAIQRDSVRLRQTIDQVTPLTAEGAPHVGLLRGLDLALRGDRVGALQAVDRVCGEPMSASCLRTRAGILHALGEHDAALTLLERVAKLHDPFLPNALSEPWYDDLGEHPRLAALRSTIGVPN